MSDSLDELRARAAQHNIEIEARRRFFTVTMLAERWGCRRYSPADVSAYEQRTARLAAERKQGR